MMTDESLLPEYAANPFIARLPPPLSVEAALAALTDLPSFNAEERLYPAHLRAHCIQRLGQYFEPLIRHLTLEQRIGLLIRQGYLGRNPMTTDYIHRLRNNHERIMQRVWTRRRLIRSKPPPRASRSSGPRGSGRRAASTASCVFILRPWRMTSPWP
ncbi:hypothetical protein [Neomegalonema sp.]|uniref:hypothetical protein n=1 Tax=Neomegalonema sp. TaxID=2039713 RepID=UPI0026194C09|nr:hypothetical protein [Neomegalonema sp.]MDD2869927.1 hypothetical protein [Neomegalonema sp.]